MEKERLKPSLRLGILMDALYVAYRDKDKRDLIPKIENKITNAMEDLGVPPEDIDEFIRTLRRWIDIKLRKEVLP